MYKGTIYREESISLLRYNQSNKTFQTNSEALEIIRQIKGPLAILGISGLHNSGKSYLLNRMVLNRPKGFTVNNNGSSNKSRQKGIQIWGKPLLGQNKNSEAVSILVMDTYGIGDRNKHIQQIGDIDLKILQIQMILASVLIYNWMDGINLNDGSEKLKNVLKQIQKNGKDWNQWMPDIYWILRDVQGKNNNKFKNNTAVAEKSFDQLIASLNQQQMIVLRKITKQKISLLRPVSDTNNLKKLDSLDYQMLSPEFVQQMIQIRRKLFKQVTNKTIKKKNLQGDTLEYLICALVNQFQNGVTEGKLQKVWKSVCKQQCENAIQQSMRIYKQKYKQNTLGKGAMNEQVLINAHKTAKKWGIQILKKKCLNNSQVQFYIQNLKKKFRQQYEHLNEQNRKQNIQSTKQFLGYQYQTIQRKVKTREIRDIHQFKKQIALFQQFFKKKGNNSQASRQAYFDFIFKKIIQSITIIINLYTQQIDQKKNQLIQQNQKIDHQLKQFKKSIRKQKQLLQGKITKLQQQKNQLSSKNINLEERLLQLKNQKEILQKSLAQQISRERLQQSRLGQQIKKKLNFRQSQLQDLERSNLVLQSQLKKKQILFQKSFENYSTLIQQYKLNQSALRKQIQQLKQMSEAQQKLLNCRLQNRTKQYKQIVSQMQNKLIQQEEKINFFRKKAEQLQTQIQKNQLQKKQKIQQIVNLKNQTELQLKIVQQKLENSLNRQRKNDSNQQNNKFIEQIKKVNQQLKAERSDKQKMKALLEQKIYFMQIQKEQDKKKYLLRQESNKNLLQTSQLDLLKTMTQLKTIESEKKQMQNIVQNLQKKRNDLNNQLQNKIKKIQQYQQQIVILKKSAKQREQQLQLNKSNALEQIKMLDLQKMRLLKTSEARNSQQVHLLRSQIQQIRINYESQIQQIKKSSEQSLRQLKNFHSLQKQRLQLRLLQQKTKGEKRSENFQSQAARKLRQLNNKYQQQIFQLKRKMWQQQKNHKLAINQLQYEISTKRDQLEISKRKIEQLINKQEYLIRELKQQKMQELLKKINQKQQEVEILQQQKIRLEQIIKKKEIVHIQLKESQDIQKIQKQISIQTLQSKINDLMSQIQLKKKQNFNKTQGLIQQNIYLIDKINRLTQQKQQSNKKYEVQYSLQRQKIQSIKKKLIQAYQQIHLMEEKYERARRQLRLQNSTVQGIQKCLILQSNTHRQNKGK